MKDNLDKDKYSHIIINKSKRVFFSTVTLIAIILFATLLFENILRERHWATVAIPMSLLGSLFIFMPRVEKWVYEPWQSNHQKYERHFND